MFLQWFLHCFLDVLYRICFLPFLCVFQLKTNFLFVPAVDCFLLKWKNLRFLLFALLEKIILPGRFNLNYIYKEKRCGGTLLDLIQIRRKKKNKYSHGLWRMPKWNLGSLDQWNLILLWIYDPRKQPRRRGNIWRKFIIGVILPVNINWNWKFLNMP